MTEIGANSAGRNSLLEGVRSISARNGRIGIGFAAVDRRSPVNADVSTVAAQNAVVLPTGFKILKHKGRVSIALACGDLDDETLEEYEVVK